MVLFVVVLCKFVMRAVLTICVEKVVFMCYVCLMLLCLCGVKESVTDVLV